MISLSIIIPVYNGEKTLRSLVAELLDALSGQTEFEIIFVHDCGPDNSWDVIRELKERYPHLIRAVRLTRNFGQHNALICGFEHAQGEFIVTMDEDLQHSPDDIRKLIEKQSECDYDVTYGTYGALQHTLFRNVTSAALKRLIRVGIPGLHKDYSAFRLIRGTTAKSVVNMQNSYTFLDGYLAWVTTNVGSCLVKHRERLAGRSSYGLFKLVEHSINIFVTFSNLPMRLLIAASVGAFLFTACYSAYLIVRKFVFNDFSPGYASLMVVMGLGVGMILLGMGIIGEYIHRINMKTTRRPDYVVREVL